MLAVLGAERTTVVGKLLVSLDLPRGGEEGVGLPIVGAGRRLAQPDESLAAGLLSLEGGEGLEPGDL